ncbi:hypothetical protein E2C01_038809 [Portunus trituberculatus]|uniref:Uncharacterized protein n=1 Tax=Portunus trituberculatus TaxID=210409 RepID=A0A5B7FL22_PORTR|nr:hypothetical protein [Portunus trituberculatus]
MHSALASVPKRPMTDIPFTEQTRPHLPLPPLALLSNSRPAMSGLIEGRGKPQAPWLLRLTPPLARHNTPAHTAADTEDAAHKAPRSPDYRQLRLVVEKNMSLKQEPRKKRRNWQSKSEMRTEMGRG